MVKIVIGVIGAWLVSQMVSALSVRGENHDQCQRLAQSSPLPSLHPPQASRMPVHRQAENRTRRVDVRGVPMRRGEPLPSEVGEMTTVYYFIAMVAVVMGFSIISYWRGGK